MLDETHAPHVCGEVKDLGAAVDGLIAVAFVPKVEDQVFDVGKELIPLAERLSIDRPDAVSLFREMGDEMTSDESSRAGDQDLFNNFLRSVTNA